MTTAIRLRPPEGEGLATLMAHARQLGPDEVRLLGLVAERLVKGQGQYGNLELASDRRNFNQEATEELVDAMIYRAAAMLLKGAV